MRDAKVHALEDVDSHVDPGYFVCVVGRSGHGKTTLLRVLAGLLKLGDTTVMGPVSDRAMVFQQDTVFPWLRVRDNVEFGLRANKLPEDERNKITNYWLSAVGWRSSPTLGRGSCLGV